MGGAPTGNGNGAKWHPDHDAALKEFFADGMTHSEMAAAINAKFKGTDIACDYSRNAAIGRTSRLHLRGPHRHLTQYTSRAYQTAKASAPPKQHKKRDRKPVPPRIPRFDSETVQIRCAAIEPRHLNLLDLGDGDCRYPFGDSPFTFCGHRVLAGRPYCLDHFALTLKPTA